MHLTEAGPAVDDLVGPLVEHPLGVLADQLDVVGPEPGLLAQLAPGGVDGPLAALQPALGELPLPGDVHPLERQDPAVLAPDGDDDPGAEVTAGHPRHATDPTPRTSPHASSATGAATP